jgi:hypothetical protein
MNTSLNSLVLSLPSLVWHSAQAAVGTVRHVAEAVGVEDRFDAAVHTGRTRMVNYALGGGVIGTLLGGPLGTLLGATSLGAFGAVTGAVTGFVDPSAEK